MEKVSMVFGFLGGAVVGYILMGLSAAVGYWIGGLIFRFRFESFTIFLVKIKKQGKKILVSLCDPNPVIRCKMTDPKPTKIRSVISMALSLAVALFATETVCIGLMGTKVIPKNPFTVGMALVMFVYSLVLITFMAIAEGKKTGDGDAGVMRMEYERCYGQLLQGEKPGNLTIKEVEYSGKVLDKHAYRQYLLIRYYHDLDLGDYTALSKIVERIEDVSPEKWSKSEMDLLSEMVFYYLIVSPREGRAKYFGDMFLAKIEGAESVNVKRTYAYYLLFEEKNKGGALQIAMEALKMVDQYPLTGCQTMERKLLEALVEKISNS